MARTRDQKTYQETRERLVQAGLDLFRSKSFDGVGISDILDRASTPKGSFYHYFANKDEFGLAVADAYHDNQMEMANRFMRADSGTPFDNLRRFFEVAAEGFKLRGYADGCLMCNLSSELADQKPLFQDRLSVHWDELTSLIADTTDRACVVSVGLSHLSRGEAANHLINSWAGTLTRMKAERSVEPITLFMKTYFERGN